MATKVKPSRLQVTGTPQAGNVPVYVNDDCFQWGSGGGGGGGGAERGNITGTLCNQIDLQVALNCKLDASALSNTNYGGAWSGDTTHTATKNAIYTKLHTMDVEIGNKAADNTVVKLSGNQTIAGTKTFSTSPVVPDKCAAAVNCGTAIATEAQVYNVATSAELKCNMVCDLTGADNDHYPSAKAVADALSCAGAGDMLKSVYDPNNVSADAFDYCNFINTPTIPTDNCQLSNSCGYITSAALSGYAQTCDIPTDNCQLANGCGYTTCTGTISNCAGIVSALGYTPYNSTNPNGYTTCTGTLVAGDLACYACCCDIPTDNCQLANGCGYTTCTGTISDCAGIVSALGYTPYSNANPNGYTTCTGTLQSCDIACVNGCCLTNGGNICIQGGGGIDISSQCCNILTSGATIWAGCQCDYDNLGTYDSNTVYLTI